MNTYAQFAAYLGNKNERPLANNTRVHRIPTPTENQTTGKCYGVLDHLSDIAIKLHGTDIIIFKRDGSIHLNSGGWRTPTTKARINEFSPVQVWQKAGIWSVSVKGCSHLFADGMVIHPDCTVTGSGTPSEQAVAKSLRKSVNQFAALCAQKFPLPHPTAGDCFYCQMREVVSGKPLGEVTKNTDHILSHIREGYVVPSLVWNALESAGYHPGKQVIHSLVFNPGAGNMADVAADAVKRSVRKYMLRQLELA